MTGKYTPLEHYLHDLMPRQNDVTITFDQLERILNDKLPPSAYTYQAWWANQKQGSHVEASAWLNAGWKVDAVDFKEKCVRFMRM